jgi:hypothetical protein
MKGVSYTRAIQHDDVRRCGRRTVGWAFSTHGGHHGVCKMSVVQRCEVEVKVEGRIKEGNKWEKSAAQK